MYEDDEGSPSTGFPWAFVSSVAAALIALIVVAIVFLSVVVKAH
ncbi:MAG TPA: hypothetical protein VJH55_02530 [Candidatus Paceibacterota bacterium]